MAALGPFYGAFYWLWACLEAEMLVVYAIFYVRPAFSSRLGCCLGSLRHALFLA